MRKKIISAFSIIAIVFGTIGFNPGVAVAAQMTGVKDTMSTLATSATATHTIQWTLPGSDKNTVNDTIAIDFVAADIVPSGTWQTSDFTFTGNGAGSNVAPAAVGTTGSPATCSGSSSTNYIVNVDASAATFTITLCTGWTQSASAFASTFVINGTAASGTGLLTNKSTDIDSSKFTITDTGDDTDSATGAIAVETNGVVTVTANVDPTLTFSNSQSTVDFGTLTSGAARYATGGASSGGNSSSSTNAHALTVGTNATSGYTVTYLSSATLTSGANNIAAATISGSASGTPGTAQFALQAASSSGSPTIPSAYQASSNNWKFQTSLDTLFSAGAPASSDSVNVRYIANIPASQPAGSYSTTITYVATGNF